MRTTALRLAICSLVLCFASIVETPECAGQGLADSMPVLRSLRLLAEPTERPAHRLAEVGAHWSVYDYRDSIIVAAIIEQEGCAHPPFGELITSIELRVGRRLWIDTSKEIVDPDATASAAVWFPAIAVLSSPLLCVSDSVARSNVMRVGVIHPAALLERLRRDDPDVSLIALRLRAVLISPTRGTYTEASVIERIVSLNLGD